jgi:hypothetical protein
MLKIIIININLNHTWKKNKLEMRRPETSSVHVAKTI